MGNIFENMSDTQLASFILGIIFSVLAIGAVIFAYVNAERMKSQVGAIILTMIMPFLAFTSWLYCIFSFIEAFRDQEVINLVVSIVLAGIISFMLLIVSKALLARHFSLTSEEKQQKQEERAQRREAKRQQKLLGYTKDIKAIEDVKQENTPQEDVNEIVIEPEDQVEGEIAEETEEVTEEAQNPSDGEEIPSNQEEENIDEQPEVESKPVEEMSEEEKAIYEFQQAVEDAYKNDKKED